jgi:hypothetical protein
LRMIGFLGLFAYEVRCFGSFVVDFGCEVTMFL